MLIKYWASLISACGLLALSLALSLGLSLSHIKQAIASTTPYNAPRASLDTDDARDLTSDKQGLGNGSRSSVDKRRGKSRLANTQTYGTYYAVPDITTLDRLSQLDVAIVQPNAINADQIRAIQITGKAISYLAIGEIGDSNTYYQNGRPVLGISIRKANPEWFVGKNPNFDSYFANPTSQGWRDFLVQQANFLINTKGFDGLFLDTVDTVDVFTPENKIAFKLDTPVMFDEAKRGFIDIVKALRSVANNVSSKTSIISNRGFTILLDSENPGGGTQSLVDAVMYEVASSLFFNPTAKGELNPNEGTTPGFYWTWKTYLDKKQELGQLSAAQRTQQEQDNLKLDRAANAYRAAGGVVLAQDFATPTNTDLICQSYVRAKANGWLPAYSDIGFRFLYDLPETTHEIQALPGCRRYNVVTQPDYRISFSPRVANAGQGRGKTLNLNIASIKGYTDNVALTIGQLPAGVTASLGAADATPGTSTNVSLTLTVDAAVPPGEYIIPVKANSASRARDYNLRLVVNDSKETLWVANAGNFTAQVYDKPTTLTADSLPNRSFADTSLFAQVYDIAVDKLGRQYLLENTSPSEPNGRVLRYGALDASAPEQTLSVGLNRPTGIALSADGTVWVANSGLLPNGTPSGTAPNIASFASTATPDATNNTAPTRTIALDFSTYGYPKQIAFDAAGNLWATTTFGFALGYKDITTANPVRFAVIGDVFPGAAYLNTVNGLRFDAAGDLWLSGDLNGGSRLIQVKAGSWATDGTVTRFSASNVGALITNGVFAPWGLVFDSAGSLWVVNQTDATGTGPGSVVRYTAGTLTSNPSPTLVVPQSARFALGIAIAAP
jgi:endo-alpha-1,4-polygalactosaminidase (GH114 family)